VRLAIIAWRGELTPSSRGGGATTGCVNKPVALKKVGVVEGELTSKDFLAMNPTGQACTYKNQD